jgi:hypothetical protein
MKFTVPQHPTPSANSSRERLAYGSSVTNEAEAATVAATLSEPVERLVEALLRRRTQPGSVATALHSDIAAEQMLVLTAIEENAGWRRFHRLGQGGLGLIISDDDGTHLVPAMQPRDTHAAPLPGPLDLPSWIGERKSRVLRIADHRLMLKARVSPVGHSTAFELVNRPGDRLIIPVADLSQRFLAMLCILLRRGQCLYDDINGAPIPGMEMFPHLVDPARVYPLSLLEQDCLTQATLELTTACQAGAMMLRLIGQGGHLVDGREFHPLGCESLFEATCLSGESPLVEAALALAERGASWLGPQAVTPAFVQCVALQARTIMERFGRFPATIPSTLATTYLCAHAPAARAHNASTTGQWLSA